MVNFLLALQFEHFMMAVPLKSKLQSQKTSGGFILYISPHQLQLVPTVVLHMNADLIRFVFEVSDEQQAKEHSFFS